MFEISIYTGKVFEGNVAKGNTAVIWSILILPILIDVKPVQAGFGPKVFENHVFDIA